MLILSSFSRKPKKKKEKLLDINETYIKFLKEVGCEQISSEPYILLASKLKENYGNKLHIEQKSKKQGSCISFASDAIDNEMKNVALFLRAKIKEIQDENTQAQPNDIR